MLKFYKIFLIAISFFVLTGCIVQSENKVIQKKKQKSDLSSQTKKVCDNNRKVMKHAYSYIINEFEQGYFLEKDTIGAKAQLFLIKNQSQSVFAQNINSANVSYMKHYKLAKKQKCILKNFSVSPLSKIQNKIEKLESSVMNTTSK